jgi:hypothetical protein
MVVRFRAIQIAVEGKEESAIAVYWVTDGIDRCLVAFLRRHLIKSKEEYDGKLAQVTEMLGGSDSKEERAKYHRFRGMCRATVINMEIAIPRSASKKKRATPKDTGEATKKKKSKKK